MENSFLEGKNIFLRPLEKSDLDGNYRFWFNDKTVTQFTTHGRFPHLYDNNVTYFDEMKNSNNLLVLAIVDKKSKKHVGNVALSSINWIDRNAEIGIVIGEKEAWGKGFAKEAWSMLIEHGFKSLNLHRIYCGTHKDNIGMQKVAIAVGMTEDGRFKDNIFKNGKYHDTIQYSVINK